MKAFLLISLLIGTQWASGEGESFKPLTAELTNFPYPHPVRSRSFESQTLNLSMAYMDVTSPSPNGRSVILFHGKNFSGAYWDKTISALSNRGFRVIVPDQIGFGKSSKPTDFHYSFQSMALHNFELLQDLGVGRVSVVGHSMGGMLATRFGLMFPEKVERLILVNPIGLEDWKRKVPYQDIDSAFLEEMKKTPNDIRSYMQQAYFDGGWKPDYDALLALQAGWAIGPDREKIARVSAITGDMVFTQPVVHEFPDLRVPTLLIIGDRDRTALGKNRAPEDVAKTLGQYGTLGKLAAEAIPGAELVMLEGLGHLPQFEAFESYIKILLEFLESAE